LRATSCASKRRDTACCGKRDGCAQSSNEHELELTNSFRRRPRARQRDGNEQPGSGKSASASPGRAGVRRNPSSGRAAHRQRRRHAGARRTAPAGARELKADKGASNWPRSARTGGRRRVAGRGPALARCRAIQADVDISLDLGPQSASGAKASMRSSPAGLRSRDRAPVSPPTHHHAAARTYEATARSSRSRKARLFNGPLDNPGIDIRALRRHQGRGSRVA